MLVKCMYHLSFIGNTFTEFQMAVVLGDAAASQGDAARIDAITSLCESSSRRGIFELTTSTDSAFSLLHVRYTAGHNMTGMKQTWTLRAVCPRTLVIMQGRRTLSMQPAPGTRAAWHQGKLSLREVRDSVVVQQPRAFDTQSLVGTWQGHLVRRRVEKKGLMIEAGCKYPIFIDVWDRSPYLPPGQGLFRYSVRMGECVHQLGESGLRRAAAPSSGIRNKQESAPSGGIRNKQGSRNKQELAPPQRALLGAESNQSSIDAGLYSRPLAAVLPRTVRLVIAPTEDAMEVHLQLNEAVLLAPRQARLIALKLESMLMHESSQELKASSSRHDVLVLRLTTAEAYVRALGALRTRPDPPCTMQQRFLLRDATGRGAFERCGVPEWLEYTESDYAPPRQNASEQEPLRQEMQGAQAHYAIRADAADDDFVGVLLHLRGVAAGGSAAVLRITISAYTGQHVCAPGFRGSGRFLGVAGALPPFVSAEVASLYGEALTARECYGPCPNETASTYFGASECAACPRHQYYVESLEVGIDGTQNYSHYRPKCEPCMYGYGTLKYGAVNKTECVPICTPGSYNATHNGFGTCLPCNVGRYTQEIMSTTCQACDAGYTTRHTGTTHRNGCYQAQVGVERVTANGRKLQVSVFWHLQPSWLASTTDIVALFANPSQSPMLGLTGRQQGFAYTSDTTSNSNSVGFGDSRPGDQPRASDGTVITIESAGEGIYSIILYNNQSAVQGWSEPFGGIIAFHNFDISHYLPLDQVPAATETEVFFGLKCPPGWISQKGGWVRTE